MTARDAKKQMFGAEDVDEKKQMGKKKDCHGLSSMFNWKAERKRKCCQNLGWERVKFKTDQKGLMETL